MADATLAPPRQPAVRTRSPRTGSPGRLVGLAALLVLLLAMVLNTKFLTPEQVAAIAPKPFDPAATAAVLWAGAQKDLPGRATPLAELLPTLQTDVKGAAARYRAASPNEGAYVFAVTAEGTAAQVTDTSIALQVTGLPEQAAVFVPLGTAVNGTAVRDAMGFTFAQAPDQTRYQYVGDELKKLMLTRLDEERPAGLQGRAVTVVGVMTVIAPGNTVPAAKPVSIQPITLRPAS